MLFKCRDQPAPGTFFRAGISPFSGVPSLLFVLIVLLAALTPARTQAQTQSNRAAIVEIEGKSVLARAGTEDWRDAKVGDFLLPGDRFKTLERSRAVIRLSDLSLLRLAELSYIQIPPPTSRRGGLQFLRGILYYFHRDKPGVMPVSTPSAHAVVLGTEFVLTVDAESRTEISMIDGTVEFTNHLGGILLATGESGIATAQARPSRVPRLSPAAGLQWILYYPGFLDSKDLPFTVESRGRLEASLTAYHHGDLLGALAAVPAGYAPEDDVERVYLASLFLAVGLVDSSSNLIGPVTGAAPLTNQATRVAASLQRVMAMVRTGSAPAAREPAIATEWLAESFAQQARSKLEAALQAAQAAVRLSPEFGFAWAQVAELEFGFGRLRAAEEANQRSLTLAPRHARAHALEGFIKAARRNYVGAQESFSRAIELNGAMADGWLGRGLCRIHEGERDIGLADLQVAATVEPQRALLRSYLGKAYDLARDDGHARQELDLAEQLDPADPTAWLYSALLRQQANQVNQGIADLERSKALNDQRSVFRSRLLLDQDRSVRGANLAALYRDAGLWEFGVREASTAVTDDYANHSAHLFLANSYNTLRDPNLFQLRYETPTVSEHLVANLLAPVGGAALSPMISQQEYSPLLERQRFGIASETAYTSDGGWAQSGSHYGSLDQLDYALDAGWRSTPGQRRNGDLEQFVASGQFKIQLTPQTSAYVLASVAHVEAGDVRQYYDDRQASPGLRAEERQEPNVFAGLHHQWAPGVHTLFLGAHLNDTLLVTEPSATIRTLVRDGAGNLTAVLNPADSTFGLDYHSVFNAWSAELQQIFQTPDHLWLIGGRYQTGELQTESTLARDPAAFPPIFTDPAADQSFGDPLDRANVYGYWHWQVIDSLRLIAGASYDWIQYPLNFSAPPLVNGTDSRDQFSPKAGLLWRPLTNLTVRGAYTRSLGGVSYDNSVRLEPTQLGGFIQSYRSLIPESKASLVPGTGFETFHLGVDHRFPSRTYVVAEAELLRSEGQRSVGVFDYTDAPPFLAVPSSLRQRLDFEERSFSVALNQLLANEWAFSARYRLSDAELATRYPALPSALDPTANTDEAARLHQLDFAILYQHSSGFFGRGEALWRHQDNRHDDAVLPDEDFWQFNLWGGWRFARRRVEIAVGVLNLTDQNYRLNPLNSANDLPRERMLATRLRWSF